MKIIAFKRANNPALHPQFISEYIDASLLESADGYETMIEDHFNEELAKNPERHAAHQRCLKEQERLSRLSEQQAQEAEKVKDKEMQREFNRFRAWQRHQGKK